MILKRRAAFFDKDGTLVPSIPDNVDPERIRLLPGARTALGQLHAAGYLLFVVSNQPGVAHGRFREEALHLVEERLRSLFEREGVPLAGVYFCPHDPQGTLVDYRVACTCRMPRPGLLIQASHDFHLNLHRCWVIGDYLDDIEAGHKAGCRTVLINAGNETQWHVTRERTPDFLAKDLSEVGHIVLHHPIPAHRVGALR